MKDKRYSYQINMTPFIDILLVLLIVLLLSARTLAEKGLSVNLPQLSKGENVTESVPIFLNLHLDQQMTLNGESVSHEHLIENLSSFSNQQQIVLKADASLSYEDVFRVINRLHSAGFSRLALIGVEKSQ
jgi:biopolymer transport protein ExbD